MIPAELEPSILDLPSSDTVESSSSPAPHCATTALHCACKRNSLAWLLLGCKSCRRRLQRQRPGEVDLIGLESWGSCYGAAPGGALSSTGLASFWRALADASLPSSSVNGPLRELSNNGFSGTRSNS